MDVIVIGAGPAGISAGIYAARANMSFMVIEKMYPGGKLVWIEKIENYPGFPDGIPGPDLAERFYRQATALKVNFVFQNVDRIEKVQEHFRVFSGNEYYEARYIIVASGSVPKKLGIKGEDTFVGRGVSYCAICDGAFFRNKRVAVIGEGKHVITDINYLKGLASVTWIRKPTGQSQNVEGVNIINGVPLEIAGEGVVKGIVVQTEKGITTVETDGVFIFAGFKPSFEFLPPEVTLDQSGYIKTDSTLQSSMNGIYVCGDIRSGSLKQIVSAVSDGAVAINEIRKKL
ncbi:MAG TPA: FAD-dependent oxidoreductase [bacterium]|nr:FAD-dependent oxidoreductase [bacterium]HXK45110.1 FAD-dependent oxidoreductase [bacterium]